MGIEAIRDASSNSLLPITSTMLCEVQNISFRVQWFQRTTNRNPGIKWSRHDTNMLKACYYLENSWRCYLATIANFKMVC